MYPILYMTQINTTIIAYCTLRRPGLRSQTATTQTANQSKRCYAAKGSLHEWHITGCLPWQRPTISIKIGCFIYIYLLHLTLTLQISVFKINCHHCNYYK